MKKLRVVVYEETTEYRSPQMGEWYVDGQNKVALATHYFPKNQERLILNVIENVPINAVTKNGRMVSR